jgi:hypothetical protein
MGTIRLIIWFLNPRSLQDISSHERITIFHSLFDVPETHRISLLTIERLQSGAPVRRGRKVSNFRAQHCLLFSTSRNIILY